MKQLQLVLISLVTLFFMQNNAKAQVLPQDSLALVDIYNSTNGSAWSNNNNWLSAQAVSNWYGVTTAMQGANLRVVNISLMNNNLEGELPFALRDLTSLKKLRVQNNNIDGFPNLSDRPNLQEFRCQNNRLDFSDYENKISNTLVNFNCSPQKKYGTERYITRELGSAFTIYGEVGGSMNTYQWYHNGAMLPGQSAPSLSTNALVPSHAGEYYCKVSSQFPGLGDLVLQSESLFLNIGECFDADGGVYPCDQLIVRFEPGTSLTLKQLLRLEYGVTTYDTCNCSDLELWELPDSLGVEGTGIAAREKPEINGAGNNYGISLDPPNIEGNLPVPGPNPSSPPSSPSDRVVALIDTGIDHTHPELIDHIWRNNPEVKNGSDDDGNCYVDDIQGYNFIADNWDNYDYNGHGTHIAGIITKLVPGNVKIMNLKAFGEDGKGTLFEPLCAIYYATKMNANVLNLSWGYYGEPSDLLRDALIYAEEESGALVVTSAGNDGLDANLEPHYPSSFELDNLISVAALNRTQKKLESQSNYGLGKIDLAAPGARIMSAQPSNAMVEKTGTSMAAGFVSRTAVLMLNTNPTATFAELKDCILLNTDSLALLDGFVTTSGKLNFTKANTCIGNNKKVATKNALLDLRVLLQGPYDSNTKLMNDDLRNKGLLPLSQPFNVAPWFYKGTETVSTAAFSNTGEDAVVDWVLVQIHDENNKGASSAIAGLLKRNGKVVTVGGTPLDFAGMTHAGLLKVIPRNHLAICTSQPVSLDYSPTKVDFTRLGTPLLGGAKQQKMIEGLQLMRNGDTNRDGKVDADDHNAIWKLRNTTGYLFEDINMDGIIDAEDRSAAWNALITSD